MTEKIPTKFLLLCFPLLAIFFPCNVYCWSTYGSQIKGMFVFGSSLVDNGNNNFLLTLAKANYSPYGVDFPGGPSGRFTNGMNVIDLLGEELQLPSLIPVFYDPSTKGGRTIVHGVNYASGGSGILNDTGSIAGNVVSLNEQIRNFDEVTLPELKTHVDCRSTDLLHNYLFVVGSGGNDYSFNYFLTQANANVSVEAFTDNLINSLSQQLKKLYSLGGRKFVLMSVNPLGCNPVARASQPTGQDGCIQVLNQAAHLFNSRLRLTVDFIRPQMPGSTLVFVNSYKIITDIIGDPVSNGFNDTRKACCQVLSVNEGGNGILCKRGGRVCAERNIHVFFDGLHPTEAVNIQIAKKAFGSYNRDEVYPINVRQLAKL
ncbi:GDSL esterase/lipase At4g16230-like [Pistacia vera]|uniref:GDSL esterase/lipase At4g16230-like n=1 Tax=Pistacia vera TaxID=55513 RepID=UPI001263A1FE|nr:GDSL esterase/lipase At4g16230-like [Pistacia vera]